MLKRLLDICLSFMGLVILLPFMLCIGVCIALTSYGGVFYLQERVGRDNKNFKLFKFRTMVSGSEKSGLLTVGGRDSRITKLGYYLRKYKLDELPQLLNVFFGSMSLVGPRPEVRKYVDLYTEEQREVLKVKPGITDYASLEYFSENDLLAKSSNPEQTYIQEVLPAKLALNRKYISEAGIRTDIKLIFKTVAKILS